MTTRIPLVRLVTLIAVASAAVLCFGVATASAGNVCNAGFQVCAPSLTIYKYGPYHVIKGDPVTYHYQVYNNGNTDLVNLQVTDDKCSPVEETTNPPDANGVFNTGEWRYFECTTTPAGDVGDQVTNTATASAQYGKGSTVDNTAQHTLTIVGLSIVKTVDLTSADPFDTLNYTVTITHGGPAGVQFNGQVSDSECFLQSDDPDASGSNWSLDNPGDSVVYTCSRVYDPDGDDQEGTEFTNQACFDAYAYNDIQVESEQGELHKCASATTTLAQHFVSGVKFEDMNADGTRQSDEPALPGMVIYRDSNGNGVRDEGEPSATSDANGHYSIPVPLGASTIRQDTPSGFTCSFPAGCAYTVDLPQNSAPPRDVASRANYKATDPTGLDFGDWRPATVSGTVVNDANGNGVRDAGEGVIAGVTVYADLNGNSIIDQGEPTATSAGDGTYAIGGLKPGGYVIRQGPVADKTCTAPAGCNYNLTLVSNQSVGNRDFLDTSPAQVVLGARVVAGTARIFGKTGCVSRAFNARIRGKKIQRVMFFVDGRYMKALTKPTNGGFTLRVNVNKFKIGAHTVSARITFATSSRTKNKTLRLSFQRCAAQLRAPQFTG